MKLKILIPILIFLLLLPVVAAVDFECMSDSDCEYGSICDFDSYKCAEAECVVDQDCEEGFCSVNECVMPWAKKDDADAFNRSMQWACRNYVECPKPNIGFFILLGAVIGILVSVPLFIWVSNFVSRADKRKKNDKTTEKS